MKFEVVTDCVFQPSLACVKAENTSSLSGGGIEYHTPSVGTENFGISPNVKLCLTCTIRADFTSHRQMSLLLYPSDSWEAFQDILPALGHSVA